MADLVGVEPLMPRKELHDSYDCFIATVGFERRANYVSRELKPNARRRLACAFAERQVGAFDDNRDWFVSAGFDYIVLKEGDEEQWAQNLIDGLPNGVLVRLCIDISSMSRLRMSAIIAALLRTTRRSLIEVDFVYSVAKWTAPSTIPEPITRAGSVLPLFAGWSSRPELPTVAVLGLGYEPDKAVGAYEYLEATQVWTFCPKSTDSRYDHDVNRGNRSLLARVPLANQMQYRVSEPFGCFGKLESITYAALSATRPVLLPFGPKIFALCALLVACVHREVPVWRISSGQFGDAPDRRPSGELIGLRAVFGERA